MLSGGGGTEVGGENGVEVVALLRVVEEAVGRDCDDDSDYQAFELSHVGVIDLVMCEMGRNIDRTG